MTTFATDESAGLTLDDRERAAWAQYADTLRTLGTVAYAQAEPPAWEHLQEELAEIALARAEAPSDVPAF
ncbi:MAG: hypothetical protein JWO02_1630 [Solirubrobacterales bacterium]|nr:hypothetical protein [Solirubrobacterales bacterium]